MIFIIRIMKLWRWYMWKNSLFKLYFQDKNKYNEIYNQRLYSENSYYLDFKIEG